MPATKYLYLKQNSFPPEEYLSLQKNIDPAKKCYLDLQNSVYIWKETFGPATKYLDLQHIIYPFKIMFISEMKYLNLQKNI